MLFEKIILRALEKGLGTGLRGSHLYGGVTCNPYIWYTIMVYGIYGYIYPWIEAPANRTTLRRSRYRCLSGLGVYLPKDIV